MKGTLFQKELYNFQSLYKFIQRTSTVRVRVRVTFRLTVSQSICLGVKPILGLLTKNLSLSGSVLNCHNVAKHTEFCLGELRFNATCTGNVGCFKKSFTVVFQIWLCDECYVNVYTWRRTFAVIWKHNDVNLHFLCSTLLSQRLLWTIQQSET
jgi:hypothetical protein